MKKIFLSIFCSLVIALGGFYWTVVRPAWANVTCSLPFTLTNGTIADASQVMANYNALVTCLTNAAAAGANNDITSLSGLTTPITPNQGGSQVYGGGTPTVSGNIFIFNSTTPSGWSNATNQAINFVSPVTNTTVLQFVINNQATKNVFKLTSGGPVALSGGEVVTNQAYNAIFDGTQFEINPFPNVTAGWGIASVPTAISINTKNPPYGFGPCVNMTISATVGSNLLGVQLFAADTGLAPTSTHPILCNFRDPTIANGDPVWVSLETAQYIDTNGAGASLGTINALPFREWLVLYYNGGTPKLGLWQSTSFTPGASPQGQSITLNTFDEGSLQSPTAISAAATNAGTFYSPNGTAITNSPFRILGYMDWSNGLTTAGNYASGPTKIQPFGPGIRKPGDRINYAVKTNTATSTTTNTYSVGVTPPTPTGGATVVSLTVAPAALMDIFRFNGQAALTNSTGGTASAYINNTSLTYAIALATQPGLNAPPVINLPVQFSTILTSASQTFTFYYSGSAGTTCLNGTNPNCTVQGSLASWMSVEEIQP